jgi:ABC-type nitrate/sulfonate/bicarbonate transport system permease component
VSARLRAILLEAWLPVGLIVLWWFASAHSTNPFWPPLQDIWHTVKATWLFDRFDSDLIPTMKRVLIGFAVAVVIGVGFGALLGASPLLRKALEPTLEFIRAAPAVAMIPISILVFGIDDGQKVFVIVFVAVWAILLNTTEGVRGIDPTFHDMAHIYGLRRRERVLQVILPGAMPQIFAGLRVALAQALLVGVVAEMFAARNGLGKFIRDSQEGFRVKEMWSGIIVIAIAAYLVNLLFVVIERRVLYWHRGWRASSLGLSVDSGRRTPLFKRLITPRRPAVQGVRPVAE